MDQLLAGPLPQERDATCDECAMLATDEAVEQPSSTIFFNPQTKCCSYIPSIPNYLVGRILADEDASFAAGRGSVEERLRAGVCVSPLGVDAPPNFQALYGQSGDTLFGRSLTLRCPHYLAEAGGRCGVWKHRASVCATWYCKHERGETGLRFWRTMHQLLSTVEQSLARWCVLELEIGTEALAELFPLAKPSGKPNAIDARALDGAADPARSRALWGEWAGRDTAFYRECARLVDALDWSGVTAICGAEVKVFARLVRDAYALLTSAELPERFKVGALRIVGMNHDTCTVTTYSNYDPLDVPKQLLEVLGYFDGRPAREALSAIEEVAGLRLDRTLVRKLVDFGVLTPVK